MSTREVLSQERKAAKAAGDIPEWMSTDGYSFFKQKYQYQAASYREQLQRIAKTAASYTKDPVVWEDKFFNLMWKGWLSPSTPVLSNTGTNRGLSVSCSGSWIDDSINGFYSHQKEIALLTQEGFGTSGYLGDIRPRGANISRGGKASGVVPVFKMYAQTMRDVAQGTARRGSWAGYLPISHSDFDELADFIKDNPDDANVGWNITDEDIAKLNAGDVEMTRRYQKMMKLKMLTGKGYIFKPDSVNRANPKMYKDKGLEVKASNLCFTGDTMVAVVDGRNAVSILDLATESNGKVKFPVYSSRWNNTQKIWVNEIKNAIAFKTGTKQTVKVTLSDGSSFNCTPDHQLALMDGSYLEANMCVGKELVSFGSDNKHLTVVSVEPRGIEDVYDLTVEDNHNFNIITSTQGSSYLECSGILVHNCSEIALFSGLNESEHHTFTCVLSSMNLVHYDVWKDTDAVFDSTVFLDCIAEDFIQKAKKIKGLSAAVRFTEKSRALGLGTMGLHSYFQKNSIPFESFDAHIKNQEIYKYIHDESLRASQWMATELGEPEWCKGYGVRNTHRIAIAPTMSTAVVMGGASQGIEPFYGNAFIKDGAGGAMEVINPQFYALMKSKGKYSKKLIKEIAEHHGSVQHLDWLSDHEKLVYRTAFEINQEVIIRLAAIRQKWICQAQSINLFFSADESEAYISSIHQMALEDDRIKSLYYVRSQAGVAASTGECLACM